MDICRYCLKAQDLRDRHGQEKSGVNTISINIAVHELADHMQNDHCECEKEESK